MKIGQKLLGGFLGISLLTLTISHFSGVIIQQDTIDNFQEVSGRLLPGNIALANIKAELYNTLALISDFAEGRDDADRKKIALALAELDTYKAMHQLYHRIDTDNYHKKIDQIIERFSSHVTQYLLLANRRASPAKLLDIKTKIDQTVDLFVSTVDPHIDQEFLRGLQKLETTKAKNARARRLLILTSLAILAFTVVLSIFISRLLAKPLLELRDAAREIGRGRLDLQLNTESRDEIGELALAFNEMTVNLATARQELLASRDYTDNILRSMNDILLVLDLTGEIKRVNPVTSELLGYRQDELTSMSINDIVEAGEFFLSSNLTELASQGFIRGLNLSFLTRNGEKIPMSVSGSALKNEAGDILAVIIAAQDIRELSALIKEMNRTNRQLKREISDRQQAETDLASEKERLAVTLKSIGDGVITTNIRGEVVLLNKVAENLTGWSQEEAIGHPFTEVFHIVNEETGRPCANPVAKVLATGRMVGLANHTVLISRNGTRYAIADSGAPIRDMQSKTIGVVLVFRDVTKRQRMEKEVLKVKKLESLGVLAGGIAHDFNNILTAILGNINVARLYIKPEDKGYNLLLKAEKASLRAKDLTRQLLTFSKGGEPIRVVASINDIIRESADFILRGSNVRCEYHFAEDLWPVKVDAGQISQVIQNIILNANHAMPEGGVIEIRCENSTNKNELPADQDERHIKIIIRDQGSGIPQQDIDKIFDPYFSTKNEGSGLGLAVTHSIINKHRGKITVNSTPNVGTTFTIFLPASENQEKQAVQTAGQEIPRHDFRIMIMDDEEEVRSVARTMLNYLGYKVVLATDGNEAIRLFTEARSGQEPVDAIIMDLTIPGGMGGKEAVKQILALDKDARVIAASGYYNDPILAQYRKHGFVGVLTKPFQVDELGQTLDKILGT